MMNICDHSDVECDLNKCKPYIKEDGWKMLVNFYVLLNQDRVLFKVQEIK